MYHRQTDLGGKNAVHRQDEYLRIERERSFDARADEFRTLDLNELFDVPAGRSCTLERHVSGSTESAEEGFLVVNGENTVFDRGAYETVRLAIPGNVQ